MPTRTHFRGKKRKSNFHSGGNNTHLGICGGNKLSGLPPTTNISAATRNAYNVGNPQHRALVNLFPTCCDLQKQGLKQKPNACPDCAKQYLMNPRCRNPLARYGAPMPPQRLPPAATRPFPSSGLSIADMLGIFGTIKYCKE